MTQNLKKTLSVDLTKLALYLVVMRRAVQDGRRGGMLLHQVRGRLFRRHRRSRRSRGEVVVGCRGQRSQRGRRGGVGPRDHREAVALAPDDARVPVPSDNVRVVVLKGKKMYFRKKPELYGTAATF